MIMKYLELGKIVSTHGVRGELRVQYWCDYPEYFQNFDTVYLAKDGNQPYKVISSRPHGNIVLLTLEGVDTIDEANKLRGKTIYVSRKDAPLENGRYFIAELIGCRVVDSDNPDKIYGVITEVTNSGASDIWHVKSDSNTYLFPSVPEFVKSVDVEKEIALVKPIPGIFGEAEEIREN